VRDAERDEACNKKGAAHNQGYHGRLRRKGDS
jgi:hypothetical protein